MAKEITLNQTIPHLDECVRLIIEVIERAIRDYLSLSKSNIQIEQEYYDTACQFLFDDNYLIDWGGEEKNLRDFLELLNIEIDWLRETIIKGKNQKIHKLYLRRINAKQIQKE